MSKILLREQAIKLRLEGKTYGQIKRELGIEKSTLSGWLKNLSLTKLQLELLSKNKQNSRDLAREKYSQTRAAQKLKRIQKVLELQSKVILPLSKKELFLAGAFLYWGEGEKTHGTISISNTNPQIIKFALTWMIESLKIPKSQIKARMHVYADMDQEETIDYWSKVLDLPKDQFKKPYLKKTNREGLTYKGFGHGTCRLYVGNVAQSELVAMSIKAVSDYYGAKDEVFWYN